MSQLQQIPRGEIGRLQWYDAAREALIKASTTDEVQTHLSGAAVMAAYARQAKDTELEVAAKAIRERAERRLGELMQHQRETVGLAKPPGANQYKDRVERGPEAQPTLAEAGIDKHLAHRARTKAAMPEPDFEAHVEQIAKRVRSRKPHTEKPVKTTGQSKTKSKVKAEPVRPAVDVRSMAERAQEEVMRLFELVRDKPLTLREIAQRCGYDTRGHHMEERGRVVRDRLGCAKGIDMVQDGSGTGRAVSTTRYTFTLAVEASSQAEWRAREKEYKAAIATYDTLLTKMHAEIRKQRALAKDGYNKWRPDFVSSGRLSALLDWVENALKERAIPAPVAPVVEQDAISPLP
jgi:hypothetical protein